MNLSTPEGMANAKAWQLGMIDSIVDGGSWLVPRSGSVYTFDKKRKVATRTGLAPEPDIQRVLEAIGWTVKEK